jgi:hypothetical protein
MVSPELQQSIDQQRRAELREVATQAAKAAARTMIRVTVSE